jgi:hypothetical protein
VFIFFMIITSLVALYQMNRVITPCVVSLFVKEHRFLARFLSYSPELTILVLWITLYK